MLELSAMHSPAVARRGLLSGPGILAWNLLLILAVAVVTLFVVRWGLLARSQLIPALVTPTLNFEAASNPSWRAVATRMKDIALARIGLAVPDEPRAVAFTFDDGPYPLLTPVLLDLLARHHVHATFFIIGRDAQMQPDLVRRMVTGGHELGNHAFTHASLETMEPARIRRELDQTDALIQSLTGVRTRLVRPPGGRLDTHRLGVVQQMGYTVALDNVNPGDWRQSDPLQIYTYTMWHSINRAIVLMHSGRMGTIRALPTIIDAYRRKGYQFVTLSQLAHLEGISLPSDAVASTHAAR